MPTVEVEDDPDLLKKHTFVVWVDDPDLLKKHILVVGIKDEPYLLMMRAVVTKFCFTTAGTAQVRPLLTIRSAMRPMASN